MVPTVACSLIMLITVINFTVRVVPVASMPLFLAIAISAVIIVFVPSVWAVSCLLIVIVITITLAFPLPLPLHLKLILFPPAFCCPMHVSIHLRISLTRQSLG
jgi:hypothetical protein